MDTFQLWKLAADVSLVLSILLLCMRFMRSQGSSVNTRELRDLEIVLKNLVKDADIASKSLSESLNRRQQALERLLADLEGGEQRLTTTIKASDEARTRLNREMAQVRTAEPELIRETPRQIKEALAVAERELVHSRPPKAASWDEPPSFETSQATVSYRNNRQQVQELDEEAIVGEVTPRRTGAAAYQNAAAQRPSQPVSGNQYNIYGEPLGAADGAPTQPEIRRTPPRQPLVQEIEVERIRTPKPEPRPRSDAPSLEQVYEAAEKLLQAGQDLDAVAAITQLPLEEVRKLSQIIIGSDRAKGVAPQNSEPSARRQAGTDPTADPRLGVFANIKRQTQVL